MRFLGITDQGEGISREKSFQLNVVASLIWVFFFQIAISLSDFFRTALFSEKPLLHTSLELLRRHKGYSFGTAISSEQKHLLYTLHR